MHALLRALSIRQKIVVGFIMIIMITLTLVGWSLCSLSQSEDKAIGYIDFLNQRYERTRRSADAITQLQAVLKEIAANPQLTMQCNNLLQAWIHWQMKLAASIQS